MHIDISEQELAKAISDNELVIYHQPKVCMLRGEVIGSEALVRWLRDDGMLVPPDSFIPLAERSGLLSEITSLMLQHSVDSIKQIKRDHSGLSVSMNVAPADLESQKVSKRIQTLLNLIAMGITVLMDDFGTGYSSLDRLSQLPFSSLKLDKGVVQRMGSSKQNLNVVKSSISMARELRMTSVAEGVESEGAYDFLLANGCEEAQGYWISHPLTLAEYQQFLAQSPKYNGSQIGRVHQAFFNLIHFRKSLLDAAYCSRAGSYKALESVIDPEVKLAAHESRFGLWYYGIGQRLHATRGFADLEQPFLSLHACGQQFIQQLQQGASRSVLSTLIAEADEYMDNLTSLLRRLERELLLASLKSYATEMIRNRSMLCSKIEMSSKYVS